jgi:rubrerythrin
MNKTDLINGIRLDLQKEEEAIALYMSQVTHTSNSKARKVLKSIADEERVHVGELMKLLEILDNEEKYLEKGEGEVIETLHLPVERKARCKSRHRRGYQPKQASKGSVNLSRMR